MKAVRTPGESCAVCGAMLGDSASAGLCPKCLLAAGLSPAPEPIHDAQGRASCPTAAPWLGSVGDYDLLEKVGEGGMGIVYRARQKSLNRVVAIKMLLLGAQAAPEFIKRFRAEALAAASLQHPHIVAIHEVGIHEGRHFFVMDHIEGPSLARLVGNQPLPAQRAAGYVRPIAEAIHYAHERGILHRDLKPSNVLIDREDQPRVTDFGLAKRLEGDSDLTVTGQVLGSPHYLPPEQAAGKHRALSRRSDVYGLGAILYHLLTGRPPFLGEDLGETLNRVLNSELLPPRLLNPSVPRDLETVCLKCLERDPARRYPTAQAVAEELDRFLNNETVLARPVGPVGKTWRWCQRQPVRAALAVALVLVTLLGATGVLLQWRRAEQNAEREAGERRRAEAGERLARQQAYTADMNLAFQAVADNNLGRARRLLERHRPGADSEIRGPKSEHEPAPYHSSLALDLRGWEWRYLWRMTRSDDLLQLTGHEAMVPSATFTSDGQGVISGSQDRTLRLWDLRSRKPVATLTDQRHIRMVALSHDGRWLLSGGTRGEVLLWDLPTREVLAAFTNAPLVNSVAIAPDQRFIAAAGYQTLTVWDTQTHDVRLTRPIGRSHHWMPVGLAFSPDGQTLAYDAERGTVHLVRLDSGSEHGLPRAHTDMVLTLTFSPDGRTLVSGSEDRTVRVWDLSGEREVACLTNHSSFVASAAFSPDGRVLVTTGGDQQVRLWDTSTWQETAVLLGHQDEVWSVAFSPDGRQLVTASKDQTVRIWDAEARPEKDRLLDPRHELASANLSRDGTEVFLIYTNGTCSFVDTRSLASTTPAPVPSRDRPIALGGQRIAWVRADGHVWVWGRTTLQATPLGGPAAPVQRAAFSGDDRWLGVARADRSLEVWDVPGTNQVLRTPIQDDVNALAFSPDDRCLALGLENWVAEVWSLPDRRRSLVLKGHKALLLGITFSPDGATLATTSADARLILWDARTGQLRATLSGELRSYGAVAFSPDQTRVAASGVGGTVTIWNLTLPEPQEVARLKGPQRSMSSLAFLPEGNTLIALSTDADRFHGLYVWRAPSFAEIAAEATAPEQKTRRVP